MSDHFGGSLTDNGHELVQRVYYEDTDFSGAVYHARYLHFMERARTEFIRCKGLTQSQTHDSASPDDAIAFVVSNIAIDYNLPARMDDVLKIVTEPISLRGARMELHQRIYRDTDLLTDAKVTVACVNGNGRPRRMPKVLL